MAALSRLCSSIVVLSALIPSLASAQEATPAPAAPAETAPATPAEPAPAEPAPAAEAPAAEAPPPPPEAATPPPEAPKPKPPPYHLPFQLRPVAAATVLRSDTAFAMYNDNTKPDSPSGNTVVSTLLGSYKVTPEFAPMIRLGIVSDSPPSFAVAPGSPPPPESKLAFMNPVVGGTYGIKPSPETRLGLFLGLAIPLGSGGGDDFDRDAKASMTKGVNARSAMDNAMFASNYFTIFPGVGFAYVAKGLTLQVEATLLQLIHVKGKALEDLATPAKEEASRTNLTMGLHVGYFFIPQFSLGAELRHQRWLSTPAFVEADSSRRDTTTVAIGPRVHFKLGENVWFRPGIVYARGLDKPLTASDYNIVQLDLPFIF
jgi:hypothetical protein